MEGSNFRSRILVLIAIVFGFAGVVAGALGAHPPEGFLTEQASREAWNSGVYFLLFHVVVILACADLRSFSIKPFGVASVFFLCGILFFSGSIFLLAAGGPKVIGPVTPLGGLFLLFGWVALGYQVMRQRSAS